MLFRSGLNTTALHFVLLTLLSVLVLVVRPEGGLLEGLPSGPLESTHRTLESGLRSWVERQTGQTLGYVEQLYTFGDRNRTRQERTLSIGYLALVRGWPSASKPSMASREARGVTRTAIFTSTS